jgi:sugar/nucleoside kinase (ribokinase family)
MTEPMNAITLGVHVVDVLVRPVEEIPQGQGGQLVEQIRITPAGPAGGTAVTLAKLGARVRSAGAIGDDELGGVMLELLAASASTSHCSSAARAFRRPRACCRSGPTAPGRRST